MSKKQLHKDRMKLWETSLANHDKWLDKETSLFSDIYVEKRMCPVCEQDNADIIFHKSGGTYVKCNNCTMVYTNPTFKDNYLEEYYKTNHSVQSEIVKSDVNFYTSIYNKGLQSVIEKVDACNILDIGCSSGGFLDLAKGEGLETFGIELNQAEVAVARVNHTIFDCYLSEVTQKFDIITMWDVFEHIKDAKSMLFDIKEHLNVDGVLFIQIPTADSLAAKIMQSECNMFDGLEHVNLYTLDSLNTLLQSVGMEVVGYDTVISEANVISNYLNYEHPYLGSFKNERIFTEEYILDNNLGYKIQAVIKISDES